MAELISALANLGALGFFIAGGIVVYALLKRNGALYASNNRELAEALGELKAVLREIKVVLESHKQDHAAMLDDLRRQGEAMARLLERTR